MSLRFWFVRQLQDVHKISDQQKIAMDMGSKMRAVTEVEVGIYFSWLFPFPLLQRAPDALPWLIGEKLLVVLDDA